MSGTPSRADIRTEAERLFAAFRATGAEPVEADILQPADMLLDLYGEDIRARAFVTRDPLRGELMLRPDFTLPVARAHVGAGRGRARYCYMGEVFRQQDRAGLRPAEYLQVGYEIFGATDPLAADTELFALFADVLAPLGLHATIGDVGIITAAVRGLSTSAPRKARLLHHIWRPARFRELLAGYGAAPGPSRVAVAAVRQVIGLRDPDEVAARLEALEADRATPPIPAREAALIEAVLALSLPVTEAPARLRAMAADFPPLTAAADSLAARIDRLAAKGVELASVAFEPSLGRTPLEYYDGFVFAFRAADPALPPVASGGRYDALTELLGPGHGVRAVGGVIRPELVARLGGTG